MKLFTLGYSTSTIEEFVALLVESQVRTVVDVRSIPRSRLPHFNQVQLERALAVAGIGYEYLGDRLGGMPRDEELIGEWQQGHLNSRILSSIRASPEWSDGIGTLSRLIISNPDDFVCILCSEANPNACHRKAVALDTAKALGELEVVHLVLGSSARHEVGVQEALM